MPEVADALRRVTAAMQKELDCGRRSKPLDAEDLIDVLLTVADELDPFTPRPRYSPATEA
jgi:hypothetical protein